MPQFFCHWHHGIFMHLYCSYISDDGRTGSGDWYQCQTLVAQAINPSRCRQAVQAVAAAVAVPAEAEAPCPELPSNMPKLAGRQDWVNKVRASVVMFQRIHACCIAVDNLFKICLKAECSREGSHNNHENSFVLHASCCPAR